MRHQVLQCPQLDWKAEDNKELFLHCLKGLPVNFGYIDRDEELEFFNYLTETSFLKYVGNREWQGKLAEFIVMKDIGFHRDREMSDGHQWFVIEKGDTIVLSELLPLGKQRSYVGRGNLHTLFIDVTDEERAEIYES